MYTGKALVVRKFASTYKSWDLGIDALILEKLCYTVMYSVEINRKGFVM